MAYHKTGLDESRTASSQFVIPPIFIGSLPPPIHLRRAAKSSLGSAVISEMGVRDGAAYRYLLLTPRHFSSHERAKSQVHKFPALYSFRCRPTNFLLPYFLSPSYRYYGPG